MLNSDEVANDDQSLNRLDGWLSRQSWYCPGPRSPGKNGWSGRSLPDSPSGRSTGSSRSRMQLVREVAGDTAPLPAESPDRSEFFHGGESPMRGPEALTLDADASPRQPDARGSVGPGPPQTKVGKPGRQTKIVFVEAEEGIDTEQLKDPARTDLSTRFTLHSEAPTVRKSAMKEGTERSQIQIRTSTESKDSYSSSDGNGRDSKGSDKSKSQWSNSLQNLSKFLDEGIDRRKSKARVDRMGSIRNMWSFFQALCRSRGSLIPRTLPMSFFSLLLVILLMVFERSQAVPSEMLPVLLHPIAVQMVAMVLGWFTVLRCKMSVKRYFEGLTEVQFFGSKWRDAYTQVSCFIRSSARDHRNNRPDMAYEHLYELARVQKQLLHWFSILHALAVNGLQAEQLELDENAFLSRLRVIPPPILRHLGETYGDHTATMFLESKDAAAKGDSPQGEQSNSSNQRRLLKRRLLGSRTSVKALGTCFNEEVFFNEEDDTNATNGHNHHGLSSLSIMGELTEEERYALEKAPSKVDLVHGWIIELISYSSLDERIVTEPPVLSRVYQELSNGMLGFGQAHKLALVQFPFPFAQMLTMLLAIWLFICPCIVFVFTGGEVLTPWLVVILVLGYWVIQEIAIELENPFGKDLNHLPLASLHETWTETLIEVTVGHCPPVWSIIDEQDDDGLILPAEKIPLHPSRLPKLKDDDSEAGSI